MPLPEPDANRPMVLVLPFENIDGDPGHDYLANGIADDLVTDLTHFHDLRVVTPPRRGRASATSASAGFAVPDDATYVVSGSVRRASERIRVIVQLNDAKTGVSLWTERFDQPLDELFALQEELVERLPNYLVTQIELESVRRARQRPTTSLDAYVLCLQGRELHSRATEPDTLRAREVFARAMELDPNYAKAYAWQAYTVQRGFTHLWGEPRGRPAAVQALALARRSVEIEPGSSFCLGRLAFVLLLNEAWEEALETAQTGARANPRAAGARFFYGEALTHAGDPIEAEREIRLALSLNPFHPIWWRASLGRALLVAGRLQEALAELRFCAARLPGYAPCLHTLAAAATEASRIEEARAAVRGLLRIHPDLTVRSASDCLFFRDPTLTERFRAGFRAGGMPEAIGAIGDKASIGDAMDTPLDVAASENAERRQLTVMFCDLVGSTALSARLDPEDLREVVAAYHRAVAQIVARFDGFLAQYLGDGVLVYFGYPQAHEDDAERAVRAGLASIEAVGRLEVKSVKLQARIGIATGLVVDLIGRCSSRERSVVGETPNLAARMQGLAEPNAVVIAAGTRRLLGDLFEVRDLGHVEVKGIAAPVQAWQVLRPSVVASRFEALRGSTLSPLVGRDEEIDLLLRRWVRAMAGDGQIVLISGEAGLGKSRIFAALEERLDEEPHHRLRYFCSPYHQDSALYPFVDHLSRASGFLPDDPPAVRLDKLAAVLARTIPPKEDVALLADLLSLPASARHPLSDVTPQRRKERTLEALIRQFEGLAHQQPVVLLFEDVHWIDPTSRELLDLAVERIRSLPVLLIVTFRPEFQPRWIGQPQVTMLALNGLDRRDRTDLVRQIAGGKRLPDEVVSQIVERTDGVPLFIEELTKSVIESGLLEEEGDRYVPKRALLPLAIPTTLHASLLARLDRLAPVRLVAQIGAAIGRDFSYAVLLAVSRLPEDELQTALARLVASELVFQRGTPPDAVYTFKHSLVQDAAHDSLLRHARQLLHAQIAETLEIDSPELTENQPELLAQHYAEAGLIEKSVACWGKAGHRSVARSTMAEAAAQFHKGLEQLALLPQTPERRRQELEFWVALGTALQAAEGQGVPETGHAYARARELWEQLGSPSEFRQIPYGLSRYHVNRGELEMAQRLDEDLLRLSDQRNDGAGLLLGHVSFGRNLLYAGRFAESQRHLEKVLAAYDPIAHRSLLHLAGDDPLVGSQAALGVVLFCLGYPDQALAHSNAAIIAAHRLAYPPSLALSLSLGARLMSLIGYSGHGDWVEQLVAVATEHGFLYYRALGAIFRGWAKVNNGDVAEGISLLRSGSTAIRSTGAQMWMPHYTALLASACEISGQVEEAVTLLNDALQMVERTGERWLASELNRLKGQQLWRQRYFEAAEELYRKALLIAQEQGAKLWELRAATSLARLHRDQERHAEARDLLAPVYGWFTEGFDTPDLKEAKTLLSMP